ncbi:MAG: DUF4365 domain-containing protein [Pseudomonas sp.]|nr:DUF4365 domain-containing protein [Pseudomonas sp.]
MKPLSPQNIESELSYAYLHAVAAHAGVGCKVGSRHDDNAGIDAELTGWGPFLNGGYLQEVNLHVQLKATVKPPTAGKNGFLGYGFSGIQQYNDLRTDTVATPRILVVLFLPTEQGKWLEHSQDALSLRNCAYWVSLRGAPPSDNQNTQTIYFPPAQFFEPNGLKNLMSRLSRRDYPLYAQATP